MAYLIAILIALALFIGFLVLTALEKKRGTRFLEGARAKLDASVSKVAVVARSADPLDFAVRGTRVIAGHIFHDIAHVALAAVRLLERSLANGVKQLRAMRHPRPPQKPSPEETTETTVG